MNVVHRLTANWRRLHVRVQVVRCAREEISNILHLFAPKNLAITVSRTLREKLSPKLN